MVFCYDIVCDKVKEVGTKVKECRPNILQAFTGAVTFLFVARREYVSRERSKGSAPGYLCSVFHFGTCTVCTASFLSTQLHHFLKNNLMLDL